MIPFTGRPRRGELIFGDRKKPEQLLSHWNGRGG